MTTFFSKRAPLFRWLGWFFLGNALLFSVIGLRYVSWIFPENYQTLNVFYTAVTWLFILITVPGHFSLLAALCLLPVFLIVFLLPKRFIVIPLACIVATAATLLLITDTMIFSQYRFHLNGIFFEMFFSDATKEIFNFTQQEWLTFVGVGLVLLLIEIAYSVWLWRKQAILSNIQRGIRIGVGLGTCLIVSYLMFLLSCIQPTYSGITQQPQAFPLYNVILSRLLPLPDSLSALEMAGQTQFLQPGQLEKKLNYPLKPLQCEAPQNPLNVVMIVIDSWRFDMLNREVTPSITEFAQKSTRFMQHYSGGNATQPGIFSLFYSLPGTYWTAMLEQKKGPVFVQKLLKQGYQMGIFSSARLTMPAFDNTIFRDVSELSLNTPGDTSTQRDRHITSEFKYFVKQVGRTSSPFFTFLFYDAAHSYCDSSKTKPIFSPTVSECNRALFNPAVTPLPYLNRYKNALYTVDQQVNEVLLTLKKQNLLANTVVILTSDHGEEFNDEKRGYIGHASNFTDYQVKVPLLIYWPKQTPKIVTKKTNHYDIAPTLLTQVLGCKNPASDYSVGQLLDSKEPVPDYLQVTSYVNFGIRQPNRITTIFRTGNFKVDDLNGKLMPNATLDKSAVKNVFEMMNKFYSERD
jgi:membrane-anchored protein YejM (alkaline phosphatase superfamily)